MCDVHHEVQAMLQIHALLNKFPIDVKQRVLTWVGQRIKTDHYEEQKAYAEEVKKAYQNGGVANNPFGCLPNGTAFTQGKIFQMPLGATFPQTGLSDECVKSDTDLLEKLQHLWDAVPRQTKPS